ncbi:MAG TPA: DUF262 domain-containing protein [Solirubrobacterales bacterium]|nr:DUF262 domain-containing protein [Solirubrobacterales bacterium]
MQAETRTLNQLFQLDVRYAIPLYQRPYVWTQERQWEPLWEDIVTVAEHVLTEGASSSSPSHFLGAIVIQQEDNPPGTPQRFLVIDGQQRLTTLQILLNAAAHCADDLACDGQAQLIRKLIYNDPLLASGTDRFKVWPTNSNQSAFQIVMEPGGSPEQAPDDPGNEIQEAFAFFRERIADWATEEDRPDDRIEALRVTATDLLKLVAIRLEDSDNAQVIFETLNARGTPLIALDLLKNSVFLRASNESAETDALYNEHWSPELDREYWREDRRQGRLFTKNGDLFLMQWLVVELAKPIPATELFKTFQGSVLARSDCPSMEELIPRLCSDATVVRGFDEMAVGTPERRFFDLLELLDTTTMLPVALLLFRDTDVETSQRNAVLATIEGFLVRRMICGWTTKNYNRLGAELVAALKEASGDLGLAAKKFFADQTAPANKWPTDEEVTEVVCTRALYGQRRQERLVMLLWEIESRWRQLDNRTEQGLAKPANLTLEHLLPQGWEEHWPLEHPTPEAREVRNEHLHRLGNLTLTTGPLNSSLSNSPWHDPEAAHDKRGALSRHSLLLLNTRLAEQNPDMFDETAIDKRGAELAQQILAIWPGPPDAGHG